MIGNFALSHSVHSVHSPQQETPIAKMSATKRDRAYIIGCNLDTLSILANPSLFFFQEFLPRGIARISAPWEKEERRGFGVWVKRPMTSEDEATLVT